jgi:hypothetical protein
MLFNTFFYLELAAPERNYTASTYHLTAYYILHLETKNAPNASFSSLSGGGDVISLFPFVYSRSITKVDNKTV